MVYLITLHNTTIRFILARYVYTYTIRFILARYFLCAFNSCSCPNSNRLRLRLRRPIPPLLPNYFCGQLYLR